VVVLKLKGDTLWRIVDDVDVGAGGSVLLVDEDGIVIAHSDRALLYHAVHPLTAQDLRRIRPRERFQTDTVRSLDVPELQALRGARDSGCLAYRPAGASARLVAYAPLRESPWVVAIDLEVRHSADSRRLRLWRSVSVIVLAACLLGVVGLLLARRHATA
jgi:C4-dicarboxylate-specific signal transduction histidine kinase